MIFLKLLLLFLSILSGFSIYAKSQRNVETIPAWYFAFFSAVTTGFIYLQWLY